jgi:hypothetical protein
VPNEEETLAQLAHAMATVTVTKPTLTYFPFAALAETSRLLLEEAGVDYDYVALPFENWSELKSAYVAAGAYFLNALEERRPTLS